MGLERIIGIDLHGGDIVDGVPASQRITQAVWELSEEYPDLIFRLVGENQDIEKASGFKPGRIEPHVVDAENNGRAVLRALCWMIKQKEIGGFYTLGKTEKVASVVHHDIGMLDEYARVFDNQKSIPPLLAEVPKSPKVNRVKTFYLLDAGSKPQISKPEQYVMYARIGAIYAEIIGGRPRPYIGLANMGREPAKGGDIHKEAYRLLLRSGLNFIGNVEPNTETHERDIGESVERPTDVVVSDGFTGNRYIKTIPDGALLGSEFLKDEIKSGSLFERFCAWGLRNVFMRTKKRIDPAQYGGAAFLCLKDPVFKGHGTTSVRGIKVGLEKYLRYIQQNVVQKMRNALTQPLTYARTV